MDASQRNELFSEHWPWIEEQVKAVLEERRRLRLLDEVLSIVAEQVLAVALVSYDGERLIQAYLRPLVRRYSLNAIRDIRRAAAPDKKHGDKTKAAREELSHILGRHPTDAEVACHLGVTEQQVIKSTEGHTVQYDPTHHANVKVTTQTDDVDFDTMTARLDAYQKILVSLYYRDGYTEQQIANKLETSHVNVCRWLQSAIKTIGIVQNG